MKILFVACLPKGPGFGENLANKLRGSLVEAGHSVEWHELYSEGFGPLLDAAELARGMSFDSLVLTHARALVEAEGLVILHPDWWGQPPAILKGWVDRVLREGVAYELVGEDGFEKEWRPLLGGKKAFVLVSSDSADPARSGLFRSIWVDATLGACGMKAECHVFANMRRSSAEKRREWMEEMVGSAARLFMADEPWTRRG